MAWTKSLGIICFAGTLAFPASAQDKRETINFAGYNWDITAQNAKTIDYLGEKSLHMTQGRVWLDGDQLSDGVIEFDVAYDDSQGFVGFFVA